MGDAACVLLGSFAAVVIAMLAVSGISLVVNLLTIP